MTKKLTPNKSPDYLAASLWWQPVFEMQKQWNRSLQNIFPGMVPPVLWNAEQDSVETIQNFIQQYFVRAFNQRQMLTPWLIGNATEPYVDIIENSKNFRIVADVPGVETENMDVSILANALVIKGVREKNRETQNDNYLRQECCHGEFSRTIALPRDADLANARVTLDKSVLTIDVPKSSQSLPEIKNMKVAINHRKAV